MIIDNVLIKEPKISIIITYYNLGKYIKDCVFSILNQTYQNFEIIIVNDKSNEENSKILDEIQHEKIKIINSSKNNGQLLAFLKGLKQAKGEFICMVDADDVLLPNYLKTLLYVHLNSNFALVSSSCGEINKDNEITSLSNISNIVNDKSEIIKFEDVEKMFEITSEFKVEKVKAPFGLWNWCPSTSAMFRKSALKILEYYPNKEYWKTGADKVIFSLLHLIGGSCNISAVCYLYRHHGNNNSETSLTTGDKKIISDKYINKLISWNKKLRIDTYKMFIENKDELVKKYNKINYYQMLLRIIFCVNTKICAKVIKTFAHKFLN